MQVREGDLLLLTKTPLLHPRDLNSPPPARLLALVTNTFIEQGQRVITVGGRRRPQ